MTAQKTRCPFCESSFAVTTEQLAARGGHVRCGKCFQVFKADDHLVTEDIDPPTHVPDSLFDYLDQPAPQNPDDITLAGQMEEPAVSDAHFVAPQGNAAHHAAALDRPSDMDDDFEGLFSSLNPVEVDPNQGYGHSSQSNLTQEVAPVIIAPAAKIVTPAEKSVAPAKPAAPEPIDKRPKTTVQDATPFESLFGELIDDGDDHLAVPASSNNSRGALKIDSEFSDLFLTGKSMQLDALQRDQISDVDKLHAGADESWAEALLKEEPAAPAPNLAKSPADARQNQQNRQVMPARKPVATPQASATPSAVSDIINDLPVGEQLAGASRRASIDDDEDLLSYLSRTGAAQGDEIIPLAAPRKPQAPAHAAPLPASNRMLKPTKTPLSMGHYLGWGMLCVLMLGLLAGQYVYFNFEQLASKPSSYNAMRTLCRMTGCHVPLIDLSLIKTSKVVAKRHPTDKNITRFNLNITNKAFETQPMPALKLTLLKDGQVMAGRVVLPSEYLHGASATLTRLPPNMPLKASFDINIRRNEIGTFAIDPIY